MSKTEDEIFDAFCKKNNMGAFSMMIYRHTICKSFSFQKYLLSVRIDEFKAALKEEFEKWINFRNG